MALSGDETLLLRLGLDASELESATARIRQVSEATGIAIDKMPLALVRAAEKGDAAALTLATLAERERKAAEAAKEAATGIDRMADSLRQSEAAAERAAAALGRVQSAAREASRRGGGFDLGGGPGESTSVGLLGTGGSSAALAQARAAAETRSLAAAQVEAATSWRAHVAAASHAINVIQAVGGTVVQVADRFGEMAKRGAELEDLYGALSVSIAGATEATRGFVSQADLARGANALTVRGIKITSDEYADLTRTIAVLADAQGKDIPEAIQATISALAKGQERGLLEQGVLIETKQALHDYAQAHGTVAEALTETQKRQAIAEAGLRELKATAGDARIGIDGAGESVTRLGVAWGDATDEIARALNESRFVDDVLRGWIDIIKEFGSTAKDVARGVVVAFAPGLAIGPQEEAGPEVTRQGQTAAQAKEALRARQEERARLAAERMAQSEADEARRAALNEAQFGGGSRGGGAREATGPSQEEKDRETLRERAADAARAANDNALRVAEEHQRDLAQIEKQGAADLRKVQGDAAATAIQDRKLAGLAAIEAARQTAGDEIRAAEEAAKAARDSAKTAEEAERHGAELVRLQGERFAMEERLALREQEVLAQAEADEADLERRRKHADAAARINAALLKILADESRKNAKQLSDTQRQVLAVGQAMASAALGAAVAAAAAGESMGTAALDATKTVLRAIAQESLVKASFATAEGWLMNDPSKFVAAKVYAVTAALAGGAAIALGRTSGEEKAMRDEARRDADRSTERAVGGVGLPGEGFGSGGPGNTYVVTADGRIIPAQIGGREDTSREQPMVPVVNVYFNGVVGDPREVGRQINEATTDYYRQTRRRAA